MEIVGLPWSKALVQSAAFHLILIGIFTVKTLIFPEERFDLQNAIRVDLVAMPEKAKKVEAKKVERQKTELKKVEIKKVERQKTRSKKPKPGPKVNLRSKKSAKAQALARIKALQAIEEDVARDDRPDPVQSKKLFKGNIIAFGTDLTGINKIQHRNYVKELDQHVKTHWILPQWLANANLRATVRVFIDKRGYVVKKEMASSSGHKIYDQMVMGAIQKASPFPPPPQKFVDIVAARGVEFGFPE